MLSSAVQLLCDCDFLSFFFFCSNRYKIQPFVSLSSIEVSIYLGTVHTPSAPPRVLREHVLLVLWPMSPLFSTLKKKKPGMVVYTYKLPPPFTCEAGQEDVEFKAT